MVAAVTSGARGGAISLLGVSGHCFPYPVSSNCGPPMGLLGSGQLLSRQRIKCQFPQLRRGIQDLAQLCHHPCPLLDLILPLGWPDSAYFCPFPPNNNKHNNNNWETSPMAGGETYSWVLLSGIFMALCASPSSCLCASPASLPQCWSALSFSPMGEPSLCSGC